MMKHLGKAGLAALTVAASTSSFAGFEDFCVNSLAIPGASATPSYTSQINGGGGCMGVGANSAVKGFTADKFNGGYQELLQVTAVPSGLHFDSTVIVSWGQLFANEGSSEILAKNSLLNDGAGYGLYAIVRASGTLSGGQFTADNANFTLWADAFNEGAVGGGDTTKSIDTTTLDPILTNTGDDHLLGSGNFSGGFGSASAPGRFTFTFKEFSLTTMGDDYFIAPKPFYVNLLSDGDVDTVGFNVTGPGQFSLVGDVSANFFIPEPGSLALAGLALSALGLTLRRRRD